METTEDHNGGSNEKDQESAWYLYSGLASAILQVPLFLTISELIFVQKTESPYEIGYAVCLA